MSPCNTLGILEDMSKVNFIGLNEKSNLQKSLFTENLISLLSIPNLKIIVITITIKKTLKTPESDNNFDINKTFIKKLSKKDKVKLLIFKRYSSKINDINKYRTYKPLIFSLLFLS